MFDALYLQTVVMSLFSIVGAGTKLNSTVVYWTEPEEPVL